MHPRSRIRGRDPPSGGGGGPAGGGGRYRRRSPPPPSPRHQRRPPQTQRRSPDRPPPPPPSRYDDSPLPDISAAGDRRSRAGILLEAGRLAAHYLVAQGVLPVHLLRAREDPNHKPAPRHEPPAPPPPATYGRKLDDQDDPRSRRNAGDWGRGGREDHDRQPRRSNWDRRSQSFDGRRKYNDAAGDVDRGARRTRDYEEPKRPPMSRSYSHNDRRPSTDSRVDRRRRSRSRSRSRSRTRSYHASSKRDSDWRAAGRDFDQAKVLVDSATVPAAAGDGNVEEMPRQQRVPSSLLVAEADGSADPAMAIEDGEMESEVIPLDHTQDVSEDEEGEFAEDISEDEDGEFAATHSSDGYAGEMDVAQPKPSDVESVEEPVEEPVCSHSQLTNVVEEMEAGSAPLDASMMDPMGEGNGCSEVRGKMEDPPPLSEAETIVGDLNRDEQDLPAWYRIFDLSVVEAPEGCEITEIPGDPPTEHVSVSLRTNNDASETQAKDDHAGVNSLLRDEHDLSMYDLNNEADEYAHGDTSEVEGQGEHEGDNHALKDVHDLNRYDLNNEAVEDAHDNVLLENEKLLLNHGMGAHDMDRLHLSNGQLLMHQNENGEEHGDHRMEDHLVSGEQLLLDHGADGHHANSHEMEPKVMLLPTDVCDLHGYDLNSEQMLLHDGVEKHAPDSCHLMDGKMLFDQSTDRQARVCNMGNGRTIPVINLEDEYEQSDTRGFL
ncbi:hypothetical protein HU200_006887 [Digitaria exilis]|uniref:Uncharacterized protein n=1 Tax=Digitaria exilis TaxID=1010633 RepID=A0A835FNR6_9POAL|nr:hypothetical protein HU200_006887 [Digitaria exilis]